MSQEYEPGKICSENWMGAIGSLAAMMPGGVIEKHSGTTLIRSGIKSHEFNVVFLLSPPKDPEKIINRIKDLYVREDLPWQLITTPEVGKAVHRIIEEMQLSLKEMIPGMYLDKLPINPFKMPEKLQIKRVESFEELTEFFDLSEIIFGSIPISKKDQAFTLSAEQLEMPEFRGGLYIGIMDGRAVATSLRFSMNDVAGIYFVGTIKEYRKLGIGEAMTRKAVTDGIEEGCTRSILQATEMGRPIYERMGFRTVIEYQLWNSVMD